MTYAVDTAGKGLVSFFDSTTKTWTDQLIDATSAGAVRVDDEQRIVVQEGGFIAGTFKVSDDGGKSWRKLVHPGRAVLRSLSVFLDKNQGYLLVNNTSMSEALTMSSTFALLKTGDGGNNWSVVNDKMSYPFILFAVPGGNTVFGKLQGHDDNRLLVSFDENGRQRIVLNIKPKAAN